MRDTVYCLCDDGDRAAIRSSVENMVAEVQAYVPGYRLKQAVQFESIGSNAPLHIPEMGGSFTGLKVSVFLEVEGARSEENTSELQSLMRTSDAVFCLKK